MDWRNLFVLAATLALAYFLFLRPAAQQVPPLPGASGLTALLARIRAWWSSPHTVAKRWAAFIAGILVAVLAHALLGIF